MENYRTFVGVPVKVGEEFLRAREELIQTLEGERISWVDPHRYHVTLRFIGETRIAAVKAIGQSLKKHVEIPGRSVVKMDRPGSFGPRKKPRVVWVGFEENGLFEKLKTGVDHALTECGFPTVDQPFRAHLTLGRVRSLKETGRFYRTIESMQDCFSHSVIIERLVFYRSELGKGGPVYTPLDELVFRD